MYLSKLRFFKEHEDANQNILANMGLMAANLKNNILRRMLCAYLQQELERLARDKKFNQDKAKKQKRLFARLQLCLSKSRVKKRLCAKTEHRLQPVEAKQKKEKPSMRCSMR